MDTALVVVDFQNDFTIGALPNPRGPELADLLNIYMQYHYDDRLLIGTRDAHEEGPGTTKHFADYGVHAIKGTAGFQFFHRFNSGHLALQLEKGRDSAAPSAFDAKDRVGRPLAEILRAKGIVKVEICGFIAEVCVLSSLRDSIEVYDFDTTWLPGLTAAMTPVGHDAVAKKVMAMGGHIR
jgi:nicotinamidase/pyrazinamidase